MYKREYYYCCTKYNRIEYNRIEYNRIEYNRNDDSRLERFSIRIVSCNNDTL
jgi:hypothetical protein